MTLVMKVTGIIFHALLLMVMPVCICTAQECKPEPHFWNDYIGKIGGDEIQLSYFTNTDKSITGNYRYIKNEKIIYSFNGKQDGCHFSLTVNDSNIKNTGGLLLIKTPDNFDGTFTTVAGNAVPVKLAVRTIVGGSLTQRYAELPGTTQEVETFAEKIKSAFIDNDKAWLAKHCQYPLLVYPEGKKKQTIKNEKQFIAMYAVLFPEKYKDKFKSMPCYNMFSNQSGAMMGKGEVWINYILSSEENKDVYCIGSINVFLR